MNLYSATVNVFPGQAMQHSFPKRGMTAPEVMLIRHIHGDEAVKDLKWDAVNTSFTQKNERERLEVMYGPKVVNDMFGPPAANRLPLELDEVDHVADMEERAGYGKNGKKAA